MNEETADRIDSLAGVAAAAVRQLAEEIDGGDLDTDAALLAAKQTLDAELAELYRIVAVPLAGYDYERVEHYEIALCDGGRVKRSWSSPSQKWDWKLARPAMVEGVVEMTNEEARPLVAAAMEVFADCVGLTPLKAGRKGSFEKRGLWSNAFTRTGGGGGHWTYKHEPGGAEEEESDGDE